VQNDEVKMIDRYSSLVQNRLRTKWRKKKHLSIACRTVNVEEFSALINTTVSPTHERQQSVENCSIVLGIFPLRFILKVNLIKGKITCKIPVATYPADKVSLDRSRLRPQMMKIALLLFCN